MESWGGWPRILERGGAFAAPEQCTISFECYPGVFEKTLISTLVEGLRPSGLIGTSDLMKSPSEIELLVSGVLGDDPVFGRMNCLKIEVFFDNAKLAGAREQVKNWKHGVRLELAGRSRVWKDWGWPKPAPVSWPAYDPQGRATMMINAQWKVEDDPFAQERTMWDSLTS